MKTTCHSEESFYGETTKNLGGEEARHLSEILRYAQNDIEANPCFQSKTTGQGWIETCVFWSLVFFQELTLGDRTIRGKVVDGVGQGAFFASLDWVKNQCQSKLGFKPWPGTLNLQLMAKDLDIVNKAFAGKCIALIPPDRSFCEGSCIRARIGRIPAAIVVPEEKVRLHGKRIVEILAPVKLKEALQLKAGDLLSVVLVGEED